MRPIDRAFMRNDRRTVTNRQYRPIHIPCAPGKYPGGISIVIVHYRMPETRLREFVEWNRTHIERHGARLFVVSDREHLGLPSWANVIIYPAHMSVFNLAKTANYGIRRAGGGIVCKTDTDCMFSGPAMDEVAAVTPNMGALMTYRMARSATAKDLEASFEWSESKGTIALYADHWAAICGYDERQVGYGMEDVDVYKRALACPYRSVSVSRTHFWHIAHSGAIQDNPGLRSDCWNRNDFNPCNHRHNRSLKVNWADPAWGLGL